MANLNFRTVAGQPTLHRNLSGALSTPGVGTLGLFNKMLLRSTSAAFAMPASYSPMQHSSEAVL